MFDRSIIKFLALDSFDQAEIYIYKKKNRLILLFILSDIDECSAVGHTCSTFADCNNVPGSYGCSGNSALVNAFLTPFALLKTCIINQKNIQYFLLDFKSNKVK